MARVRGEPPSSSDPPLLLSVLSVRWNPPEEDTFWKVLM